MNWVKITAQKFRESKKATSRFCIGFPGIRFDGLNNNKATGKKNCIRPTT
jgi:hypothetical protein